MSELLITGARIVTEQGVIEDGVLHAKEGRIAFAGGKAAWQPETASPAAERIDAAGRWLLPGFIDVHVHGGYGADFMDANPETLETITKFHAQHGTTGMLATTMTQTREAIDRALGEIYAYSRKEMPYAQLLGVHLEGPFVSPKWAGAQDPKLMLDPQLDWLQDWDERYPGLMKQLTLAPEREGGLAAIAWLRDHGIVAACGHTDATYADIQAAADAGLSQAVHTFNAMKPLHHREPGTVGAVLTDARISAEIIADGIHVHPAALRLVTLAKPPHGVLLITDAMSAAGLGDGQYDLGGQAVTVKSGVARLTEGGSLAGSTLTMIDALRFMVREVGVSVEDASRFASANPARQLGLSATHGSLAAGKQADVLLVSEDLALDGVWVRGKQILA
ncbi:N-acetylglucosamine-6-phosphate deacetylase [Paenibacillus oryzisoli]|uniref:N-acetylglucosamine-6-phosphate deacetylase n=1 Tax=Paenibacillus oryzisoli TaxID=1850517 RepID=UPI003D2CBF96